MKQTGLLKRRVDKLQTQAATHHSEWISASDRNGYHMYKLPCGHEQEVDQSAMKKGSFRCQTCLNEQYQELAQTRGLQVVGHGRTSQYKLFRFLNCEHEQEIELSQVRRNLFHCKDCNASKLNTEASAAGIQLVGPGHHTAYRTYKLACGHEQEMTTGSVRLRSFMCRTCGNHSWTTPSYLYVIRVTLDDGQNFIKLGYSNNIERRIKEYGLPYYAKATVLATALFNTREEADVAESMLFDKYKEWKIPPTEVDDIFTRSGSTEVYHHSIEDSARLFVRDLDFLVRKGIEHDRTTNE